MAAGLQQARRKAVPSARTLDGPADTATALGPSIENKSQEQQKAHDLDMTSKKKLKLNKLNTFKSYMKFYGRNTDL